MNKRLIFSIVTILLIASSSQLADAQTRSADMIDDGRVDPADLYYLQHQWQMQEKGADLSGDGEVDENDLIELRAAWHQTDAIDNPYEVGRACGIYAVSEFGGKSVTSEELEIEIMSEYNPDKTRIRKPVPSAESLQEVFHKQIDDLSLSRAAASVDAVTYGVQYDRIGTFDGMSVWIGWAATFSETYSPDGESYAWVVYFAPEAIYVALQKSEFLYSSVDVNAGVGAFWGAINPPGGEYLTKEYIESLNSVTLSRGASTALITGTMGPVPAINVAADLTFFRVSGIDILNRAIQVGYGVSVNFDLMPAGSFALPFSVSLDYSPCKLERSDIPCGMYAGFYPLLIWRLGQEDEGSPVDRVVEGLEGIVQNGGGSGLDSVIRTMLKGFAAKTLPVMYHLQAPGPVSLEDDVPPSSNAEYFSDFLQRNSAQPSPPNTSIDHLIRQVQQWLQTGETSQLPQALAEGFQHNEELLGEYMKPLMGATKEAFEVAEAHGYNRAVQDGNRDDNKIFVDCVKQVPCPVGQWCSIVVEATEIAELYPESTPADFEGVNVRFDVDPMSYLSAPSEQYDWVPIENGRAEHYFLMNSQFSFVNGPFIHKDYNPIEEKYIELCRREIVPAQSSGFKANTRSMAGYKAELECAVNDEYGVPYSGPAVVKFYDCRDYLIGAPVHTDTGLASLQFVPRPSIPVVSSFSETLVGYSEEDASTGYSLQGRGFSRDADVTIGGQSINDMTDWAWQIISSREILFLPPDEQSLLTGTTQVQVINPGDIGSNVFEYTP